MSRAPGVKAVGAADEAWGGDMPDWVRALRDECVFMSQNKVAKRLGYSAAVVTQVLKNRYEGSLANVEERVRVELMKTRVPCPILGEIDVKVCIGWAEKAQNPAGTNARRVRMLRACNRCPHNRRKRKEVENGDPAQTGNG